MKIYDISQEVFSCRTYPGDPVPQKQVLGAMAEGNFCNVIAFFMCAHNGTHVDAPSHFIADGKTVDALPLCVFVGECYVAQHSGAVTGGDAREILKKAGVPRILIGGKATVTEEAAEVFAEGGICLLGNESQTVGPEDGPVAVHRILLGKGIALLEGVVLTQVPQGRYFLSAAPLCLGGAEGAPCRAYLIAMDT